jgi:hypothetical protein
LAPRATARLARPLKSVLFTDSPINKYSAANIYIYILSEATQTIFHTGDGLYEFLIRNRIVDKGLIQLLAVGNKNAANGTCRDQWEVGLLITYILCVLEEYPVTCCS